METPPHHHRYGEPSISVKSVRLHELNNSRNLIRTPRTFIGVLVTTGLVGKNAHEQRLPQVGQAGRIKTFGGFPVIVAILTPTNKQKRATL